MGNNLDSKNQISQDEYFRATRERHLNFLATVDGYLENASEWISIFKNSLKSIKADWSKSLLKSFKSWEDYQDLSSKVVFAWTRYNSLGKASKIDQQNICIWRDSIANLQTFSYEIDQCPYKRTLHKFLTTHTDCTLSRLISEFKKFHIKKLTCRENGKITLKSDIDLDFSKISDEVDKSILQFCQVMLKVIPKFFLDIPNSINDTESILRDAVVSGDLLTLLYIIRKETHCPENYLETLQYFSISKFDSPLSVILESEQNKHFLSAIEKLVQLTNCKSLGAMQDSIALLMNAISQSLFNPRYPEKVAEDDTIIEAFLVTIIRASTPDLPIYVNIIETFLDEETLTKKDVGKGVIKLIYLIQEVMAWKKLMPVKNCV